jgi:hypothetical protein
VKDLELYPVLDRVGEWYGEAERRIWRELIDAKGIITKVKRQEATVAGAMTARQFNAIRVSLYGTRDGRIENLIARKQDLESSIERY